MSRLLVVNGWRVERSGEGTASIDEQTMRGRSGSSVTDETGRARARSPREDPSGRRSLTGLEFKRQRSI